MTQIRVAHLLNSLKPSGMEQMLVTGSAQFLRQGILNIVVGQGVDHPYLGVMRASGCDCSTIPNVWSLGGVVALRRLLLENEISILHIHSEASYLPATLAAPRRVMVVRTIHSYFRPSMLKSFPKRMVNAIADRRCAAIIAPTAEIADHERSRGRVVSVISNWIDDRFFDGERERANASRGIGSVVLVGNCSTIKRHWLVQAALALGVPVIHIGNEDHIDDREAELLSELSLRGLLAFRGSGDPQPWLTPERVFCMPSSREGMGMSLAEALVVGSTVLISRSPGLEWALREPGVTGVKDEDWVAAIGYATSTSRSRVPRALEYLRPERGAKEYAKVYRQALLTRRESRGN